MDERQWFVAREGRVLGPFTLADLVAYAHEGQVRPTDLVSREGAPAWVAALDVAALAHVFAPHAVSSADGPARDGGPITRVVRSEPSPDQPMPAPFSVSPPNPAARPRSRTTSERRVLAAVVTVFALTAAGVAVVALVKRRSAGPTIVRPTEVHVPPASTLTTAVPPAIALSARDAAVEAARTLNPRGPLPGSDAAWSAEAVTWIDEQCPADFWSLFEGQAPGADEFERHANVTQRANLRSTVRARTYALRLAINEVELGEYDFQRQAFPLRFGDPVRRRCAAPSLAGVEGFEDDVRFAFAVPRLVREALPGPQASDVPTGIGCTAARATGEGTVHPHHWAAPAMLWLPVPEPQARAFRGRHAGALSVQLAFRVREVRADRSWFRLYGRMSIGRYVCGFHAGGGRLVVGQIVRTQVNDGGDVLLAMVTPTVAPPAVASPLRDPTCVRECDADRQGCIADGVEERDGCAIEYRSCLRGCARTAPPEGLRSW